LNETTGRWLTPTAGAKQKAMTKRQFDSIIKKAVDLGNRYRTEIDKLDKYCKEKYGCSWSDLDCDDIIDSLEFGCGSLTPMTFDEFKQSIESRLE
jgi:hypothetical protein